MAKNIQLSIPKPCHENWNGMSETEKGKFCGSCQKQVIDFSNMNDRQLAEFFKKPSTGSVCGRFMTDQLDRTIAIPKKRIPWLKYFFTIALPAFFAAKLSAQQKPRLIGKIAARPIRDTVKILEEPQPRLLGIVASEIIPVEKGEVSIICGPQTKVNMDVVEGKVVNEFGDPLPFASISKKGSHEAWFADKDGKFNIRKKAIKENDVFEIGSVGFEAKELKIDVKQKEIMLVTLVLKPMDEVVVTGYGMRSGCSRIYMGAVAIVKKDSITLIESTAQQNKNNDDVNIAEKAIEIYPNPIKSGTSLTVKLNLMDEGYYFQEIISMSGQIVKQKEIWIDEEARVVTIDMPFIAPGNYVLQLVNKKTGKKVAEKIVVQ